MSPVVEQLLAYRQGALDIDALIRTLRVLIAGDQVTQRQVLDQARLFDSRFALGSAIVQLEAELGPDGDFTMVRRSVANLATGDVIRERYILEDFIGRGGMSRVFKAFDWTNFSADDPDHYLAIKFMNVDQSAIDPEEAFKLMQREAKRAGSLRHPNIIKIGGFDRDESLPFIWMELLEGESLEKRIQNGTPPLDEALRIVGAVCDGLQHAHEHGFVHADFKPGNVFICRNGSVKVIDFGIAQVMRKEGQDKDLTVQADGALTPPYASREMFLREEPDPRDDIYALGLVAYETISGRHPFGGRYSINLRPDQDTPGRIAALSDKQWEGLAASLSLERATRLDSARKLKQALVDEVSTTTIAGGKANTQPASNQKSSSRNSRPPLWQAATLAVSTVVLIAVTLSSFGWLPSWKEGPGEKCADCDQFILVPGNTTSQIGQSRPVGPGVFEYPEQFVTLAQDISFGRREVSVGEYRRFAEGRDELRGCGTPETDWLPDPLLSWEDPGFYQSEDSPVTCVSWRDAMAYLDWRSSAMGATYRLPSEAEWELVARRYTRLSLEIDPNDASVCSSANVADLQMLGTFPGIDVVNCSDGHIYTASVNRDTGSEVSDMRGNVFEWTSDCWKDSYTGALRNGAPRTTGANCRLRVLRGGSWFSGPEQQRLTFRNRASVNMRNNTFGFRLVKEG